MIARTQTPDGWVIHDTELVSTPSDALFNPQHWRAANAITGEASGRAAAYFIAASDHRAAWVLRRYRRGGLPGKLIRDWYVHWPREKTRPFREFEITYDLYQRGLPVPRPVAAQLERHGLLDRGALLTEQIPNVEPLADLVIAGHLTDDDWSALGATIAALHNAGVWHADLNARNLLRQTGGRWFIIDLDRARQLRSANEINDNIRRLERSLNKISAAANRTFDANAPQWQALCDAHRAALQ